MSYLVTAPLVLAFDKEGRTQHRYHGELIQWLNSEQAAHFLNAGFVQHIDDTPPVSDETGDLEPTDPAITTVAHDQPVHQTRNAEPVVVSHEAVWDGLDTDRVQDCIQAIAALEIPANTGAPKVREALRGTGHTFGNDVIAAAVRARKGSLSQITQVT